MIVLQDHRALRHYPRLGNRCRTDWHPFLEHVRIGTPIRLIRLAYAGLFTGAAFLMGRIGEEQLAGHTLALQIAALAFQVPFGLAQAATIRVGLSYGARDHHGIALAGQASLTLGIGFMVVTAAIMWLFPQIGRAHV